MGESKSSSNLKYQVLLVEDTKDQALFLTHILDANDYSVVWVKDGLEALTTIKNGLIPDLLVTDLKMPTLSGFELMTEMRKLDLKIPTIITSGSGTVIDFEEAYTLGAKSFLVKPFSPFNFLTRVQKVLESTPPNGEAI